MQLCEHVHIVHLLFLTDCSYNLQFENKPDAL